MNTERIRYTITLDRETHETLMGLADRWQVSPSEAVCRVIRGIGAEQALDQLQGSLNLDQARADAWIREVRAERGR